MFGKQPNINVEMNGKEWMEYKKSKGFKLSKRIKRALPYFIACFMGVFVLAILLNHLTYTPTPGAFSGWYNAMPSMAIMSWSNIAKLTFLYFAPGLMIAIILGWIIHGVGFHIVK